MQWLIKINNAPNGARFKVASEKCRTKPLFDEISKVSKAILNHVESFIEKVYFTHAL